LKAQFTALQEKVEAISTRQDTFKSRVDSHQSTLILVATASRRLLQSSKNFTAELRQLQEWRQNKTAKDVRLRRFMGRLQKSIKALADMLAMDGCESKPCQHGGTCLPRFGKKYNCLCPPYRTGDNCEEDVDECAIYEGTHAGCQHNGTCINHDTGFRCECRSGYHGPLCQYRQSTCSRKRCCLFSISSSRTLNKVKCLQASYKCICDWGYKVSDDKQNPTCVDVNECLDNPCHPGVDCINLPGKFQCVGCPKGYHGNGQICADIDECAAETYPCSTNPRVPCFNTIGSFHCGSCPPGYSGDGRSCRRKSACDAAPCHPSATCVDDQTTLNVGGFTCHCPAGMMGDGIGEDGCQKSNSTICRTEGNCMNGGTCKPISAAEYRCLCPEFYYGLHCEQVSACIGTPCENGGICQDAGVGKVNCVCPIGFYGSLCQFEENSCGAHYTESSGNLTFPTDTESVAAEGCDFVISTAEENSALKITFIAFKDMYGSDVGSTDCTKTPANLTLFDGASDNAPIFATFCGDSSSGKAPVIGEAITMTSSSAMLRYKGTGGSFSIKWETKKRECGYRTNLASGVLVVPQHHMDMVCDWFISAPMEKHIEIEIPSVEMNTGLELNCSANELEVFDGYTSYDAHRIVHICETTNVTTLVRSTGPFLTVSFRNNVFGGSKSALHRGFTMKYRTIEPDRRCGGDITNTDGDWDFSGMIDSPNYGGFYPPNMDCSWKLDGIGPGNTSTTDQTLKLEFISFDVPSAYQFSSAMWQQQIDIPRRAFNIFSSIERKFNDFLVCLHDPCPSRDGNEPEALVLGRMGLVSPFRRVNPLIPFRRQMVYQCTEDYLHLYADGQLIHDGCNAHRPPASMLMPLPQVILRFHSDSSTQGKGFRIAYSLVCEKTLYGNGTIQTWNYPDGGRAGKCTYIIRADLSHAIRLKFKTIGMRGATTSQCFYNRDAHETATDYVEFSGGKEEDKQINRRYICARYPFVEEGEFIMSATRPLVITYVSSGDEKNRGLLMEYTTTDVGCGGVFSQSTGTISSPNYPDKYLPHMHCVYQIQVAWSKQVRLTFDNFDIEVVQNDECSYDNVAVYESYVSPSEHGKLLGRFCGTMLPPTLLSSTYKMAVVFSSDRSIAGNGFSARFEGIDPSTDCDRTYTAPAGEIIFDGTQGRYSQCDFHISVISTARLVLKMNNMSIPCLKSQLILRHVCFVMYFDVAFFLIHETCRQINTADFYSFTSSRSTPEYPMTFLRNGVSDQSPGFASLNAESSICDEYTMPVLRSHGSRVFLRLQTTDSSKTFFNISYEQIISTCGGHVEGVSGSIAAPQYPLKDSRSLDCSWTIAVALGNHVRFSLVNIDDLKSSDDNGFCGMFAANRLDVLDGPHSDARLMRRYCRRVVGAEPLTSEDHEIAVRYKQHGGPMLGPLFGFMAHFSTVCTDIVLTDFMGSIQTPGYPNKVWTGQYCSWTIKVPPGNRIQLNFHNFVVDRRFRYGALPGKCAENWLKFGEGEVAEATVKIGNSINVTNKLTEACSDVAKPMVVKSKNNVMHLTYQSKKQEQNHFWLTWTTIGCGGKLITASNISANVNRMDSNAEQLECEWQILAPVGKRIVLNVNTLSIFQKTEVSCQYNDENEEFTGLAIFSGPSNRSGYPQYTACTSLRNLTYTSHTNEMFLMLKYQMKSVMADSEGNFFVANVTFVDADANNKDECGGVVEVSPTQPSSIHSPRFPEEYERGTECQWLFKAPPGYYLIYTIKEYITPNAHEQQTEKKWIPRAINNLTCQDPLPLIEGALTIYGGNTTKSEKIERVCLDIEEPKQVPVFAAESLVTFRGASTARIHMTGEDQHVRRVGFLLEAKTACGGLVLAEDMENVMTFSDLEEEVCNITIRKKNESASGIYVRLDEFVSRGITKHRSSDMMFGNSYLDIQIDGGDVMSREARGPYLVEASTTHEEFRAKNEIRISFVKKNSLLAARMVIAYSTVIENCGGEITSREGFIGIPDIDGDFDCVWTLRENPGNGVRASVTELRVPFSPNCTDSYLEFRKWNASGPLIGRWCEKAPSMFGMEEVIWMKFRYTKPKDADSDEDLVKPNMRILFSRLHGGTTTSHVIQQPLVLIEEMYTNFMWIAEGEPDKALLVHIDSIRIPEENYEGYDGINKIGLFLSEALDNPNLNFIMNNGRPGSVRVAGFVPPADIYLPFSRLEVSFFAPPRSAFRLTWKSVPKRSANHTEEEEAKNATKDYNYSSVYACGSTLVPIWEWQEITNPVPAGKTSGYENNVHCKWTIERPLMTGLRVKIKMLDLEDVGGCPFDFISLLPDRDAEESSGDEFNSGQKYCRSSHVNTTLDYSYNKVLYVHFVTDRSRTGRGFVLQYRLTCNSFDYIRPSYGLLDHVLTSPGYPKPETDQASVHKVSFTLSFNG
ncbi:CUB domain protein, partial [Ancylostoma caninum]